MFYVVTESGLLLLSNKELSGKEFVRKCPHKLDNIFQESPNPLTPIPPIPALPHPAPSLSIFNDRSLGSTVLILNNFWC